MQFQPGTCIKYKPNPTRPGSISVTRYAAYENSKTVGEALKAGARVADFLWELERGMYQLLGKTRSEAEDVHAIGQKAYDNCKHVLASFNGPNGLALNIRDPRAEQELEREDAWRAKRLSRCEAMALDLGLPVESSAEIEASTESADIRLQRRVADAISAKKLQDAVKCSKKIIDADVGEVLELWGYCQNVGRINVMREGVKYVYSDTIGCIKQRTGTVNATPPTRRYPNFPRLLCQWLKDQDCIPNDFVCTAINLNANYAGKRHRDANNEGPSVIKAFGNFTGGRLSYWPKDIVKPRCDVETLDEKDSVTYDISKAATLFDGNRAHEVENFIGDRYSVVFFSRPVLTSVPRNPK